MVKKKGGHGENSARSGMIITGDALDSLGKLSNGIAQTCITSPP